MTAPISLPSYPPAFAGPPTSTPTTVSDLVTRARAGLLRLQPDQVPGALRHGAVLVDLRPAAARAAQGEVPNALPVERSVLEWRFDPQDAARLPIASYDLHLVLLCSRGDTSSLAAAALQQLGVRHATDVVGGFEGWLAAGLPVTRRPGPGLALLQQPASDEGGDALQFQVRPAERRAYVDGRELDLTRLEFDLLSHLIAAPQRVHTRGALLEQIWAYKSDESSRTLDVHIHRLRRKLGRELGRSLETVRGVGYRWSPPRRGAA
jgi:rhodanese-related sulfurtransferase